MIYGYHPETTDRNAAFFLASIRFVTQIANQLYFCILYKSQIISQLGSAELHVTFS